MRMALRRLGRLLSSLGDRFRLFRLEPRAFQRLTADFFQLALAATYRARQLAQGHTPKIESRDKPTVTALREIALGKVGIEMLKKVPT